jgi:murein DD-endopeptidase MepM/ murein hydrolase activator NlpD
MRKVQLFGLTAALAAAAGTTAFSLNQAPAITPTASSSKPGTITTARINRSALGSRDASRAALTLDSTRKKQADSAAQARAAELAASQTLSARRAVALQAAKAAAAAKAAKEQAQQEAATVAQQDAAKEQAQQQAKQKAAAAAEKKTAEQVSISTTAIVLPVHTYTLTARFGQAGGRWSHFHTGLDFAAPIGTPIHSVMAGKVIFAAFAGAYGRQVQVRHYDGTVTSYSHMSAFSVSVGQVVRAGGQVGAIGVTGNTTGPHVHFEVHPGGGAPIDPEPWLRAHGLNP